MTWARWLWRARPAVVALLVGVLASACLGDDERAVVRVVAGDIEVGPADEGDWLALRLHRTGEAPAILPGGAIEPDDLLDVGAVLGEVEVPVGTEAVAVVVLACEPQGCVARQMMERVRRLPADDWLCEVTTELRVRESVDIVLDWPSLGPASCDVRRTPAGVLRPLPFAAS